MVSFPVHALGEMGFVSFLVSALGESGFVSFSVSAFGEKGGLVSLPAPVLHMYCISQPYCVFSSFLAATIHTD